MVLDFKTVQTLKELEQVEWFTRIGVNDVQHAVVLSSWDEAIVFCSSDEWNNLQLEAANRLREKILQISKERFRHWNELVREAKKMTEPLVSRKLKNVIMANALPMTFVETVKWDILHLAMEAEFSDLHPPGFYASQAYWYRQGHFPCGWQGDFPGGLQVVF
ncbi:hypothetical protein [Dyadobacter crusticola]|uniref:hypothetical protein n=1 Tax=Dyadobacter crusticola TaxID=292407 RepID=UPI0004E26FAE|nr:hypothetical protein [Dyadobacter crusticola]